MLNAGLADARIVSVTYTVLFKVSLFYLKKQMS